MAQVPLNTRFIGISQNVNLTEKKSSVLNAETQPYTMQDIVDTANSGNASMSFVAKLTQTGTANPVTTVYENTAAFASPYFVRQEAGVYTMALPVGYTANKVSVSINNGLFTATTFISFDDTFETVNILTTDSGLPADDMLAYCTVEVKLFE
jgi:hypothetical protein